MVSSVLEQMPGRRVVLLGLGREGLSTYTFIRRRLPELPLLLADRTPAAELSVEVLRLVQHDPHARLLAGENYLAALDDAEIIFRSPGIPPDLPALQTARARGALVTSNTALFLALCPGLVVGITGTKGKSTTSALLYHLLAAGGLPARLVGNIGVPPLSVLDGAMPDDLFVAELSSYQLADVTQSPPIAVLLNIVPEHLSYHGTFDAYVAAKANIVRHQHAQDTVIYNTGYPLPAQVVQQSEGRHVSFALDETHTPDYGVADGWLVERDTPGMRRLLPLDELPLVGRFNVQNALAACAAARQCGLSPEVIRAAIGSFQPLEHRLEYVGTARSVRFYNDSLSTVPEAAIAAIEALAPAPVVLLVGGYERGLDYSGLARFLLRAEVEVRALLTFPPSGARLWQELVAASSAEPERLPQRVEVEDMAAAVAQAWHLARPGDVVLLSPASASFGRFVDYRDRGAQFKAAALGLIAQHGTPEEPLC
jgi:UDP-N-acetylmuramoylalanine--D-glutamate ligase